MKKKRYLQSISILAMLTFAQPMVGSLLHKAAEDGALESVRLLLERGADKEARNTYGETALHIAANYGDREIVELLINAKADVETKDNHGETALHKAAGGNKQKVVRSLIAAHADIEARDRCNHTPLHCAADLGNKETVKMLLEARADQDALSKNGDTPLHLAAQNGHNIIVEMLLKTYADVERRGSDSQRTPLAQAFGGYILYKEKRVQTKEKDNNFTETIRLLLLMDNTYGKSNLSQHAQELLKTSLFHLGKFGDDLIKSKQHQKEHYDTCVSAFTKYQTKLPAVLIELIIAYYDSFESRESLFIQVSKTTL